MNGFVVSIYQCLTVLTEVISNIALPVIASDVGCCLCPHSLGFCVETP